LALPTRLPILTRVCQASRALVTSSRVQGKAAVQESPVDLNLFKDSHPTIKEADNEPRFPPPSSTVKPHLNKATYEKMYKESIQDPGKFWGDMAKDLLEWSTPFKAARHGTSEHGDFSWFLGGELNACYNMVDRHALKNPEKVALIWESDEPGEHVNITWGEVLAEVSKLANLFKSYNLKKGDTVAIYMPMVPEALYSMLACSRLGLVHCVVFAGFSSDALRDRIQDSGAKVVMTSDQSKRGGKVHALKETVDRAVLECPTVEKVIVHRRTGEFGIPMHKDTDVYYHEAVQSQRPYCPPVAMHPEDPLFILYTSGSTGKPKGLVHTTGGYLVQCATSFKYIFDIHPESDIWLSTADVGWITGHSYNLYGPMTLGVTSVIFESIPTYPDAGRFWHTVQTHRVTQLYTAPTAIRLLRKFGDSYVNKYDLSSLRVLGSVGEPISPEVWTWYYQVPGRSKCSIVDTYWQTETGSIILTPIPGVHDMKPGSCTAPFFGIEPAILEPTTGAEIVGNDVDGVLALKLQRGAWPSIARTCLNDHKRYMETYLTVYKGMYFTGT
jgi:acetyl-CoA synthetase